MAISTSQAGIMCVVSGPSGVGKTTLVEAILARIGQQYGIERVITYTTKQPRSTELQGRDYHFIDHEEFARKIDEGFFIEWSTAYGDYYGSPVSILSEVASGKSYIAILDVHGAQKVKDRYPAAVLVWITVSDIMVLQERLRKRNTEKQEEIQKRLNIASQELEHQHKKDVFRFCIVNDSIDRSVAELQKIILHETAKK